MAHDQPRRRELLSKLWVEEEGERDEDHPRQYAAREVDGRIFGPDDIADAHERGRRQRRGDRDAAAVRDVGQHFLRCVEVMDHRFWKFEEQLFRLQDDGNAAVVLEHLEEYAQAHSAEDIARAGLTLLAGADHLIAGGGLGKGEVGVDRERAAQQYDEHASQKAADEEHDDRLPVVEARPEALAADIDHHECWNDEDSGRGHRLAHGGDRARDILLEDASLEEGQPECRDGDDGCGKGRGDCHARLQAQIGICRAQRDRHQQS